VSLIVISHPDETVAAKRLKLGLVEEPADLSLTWLGQHRWTVVPVESGCHFDKTQAQRLARGFSSVGLSRVYALATEPVHPFADYIAETSEAGLLEFSWVCSHFYYVLLPRDRSAAVLCTVNDYYLVAGPADFVGVAVGGDIASAWEEFDESAADPMWEGQLLKVAQRYRQFGALPP
jgi:hypothetical protein